MGKEKLKKIKENQNNIPLRNARKKKDNKRKSKQHNS